MFEDLQFKDWIGIYGAFVATGLLLWNICLGIRDRARLVVRTWHLERPDGPVLIICVTNHGRRDSFVTTVGARVKHHGETSWVYFGEQDGVALPHRLESHAYAEFTVRPRTPLLSEGRVRFFAMDSLRRLVYAKRPRHLSYTARKAGQDIMVNFTKRTGGILQRSRAGREPPSHKG